MLNSVFGSETVILPWELFDLPYQYQFYLIGKLTHNNHQYDFWKVKIFIFIKTLLT